MTKLITVLIIVVALYGGWRLFLYWEKVKNEQETAKKQEAAAIVDPNSLPGLPRNLEASFQAAQRQGAPAMKQWLKNFGPMLQDPRKAWIELDYCALIAREDPAEARRLFAAVKERTPASSPVWDRVKKLEKTYE